MQLENSKTQILVVLSRFPYPLEKGDKLRAFYQIKELSKEFDIILVATHEHKINDTSFKAVKQYCKEVHTVKLNVFSQFFNIALAFLSGKPIQTGYFFRYKAAHLIRRIVKTHPIQHIYCQLIRTSEYVKNIHHIPKTLDYMDALSYGVKRRINKQNPLVRWVFRLEARRLTRYEQQIFDYFEVKTIISEQDRNLIAHPDKDKIHCIPNGVDPQFLESLQRDEKYDLVFVGNMNYPPNIDAVRYIVSDILPELDNRSLLIAGANPHPSIQKLNQLDNVHVSGWIKDIRDAYLSGKVFLAPMLSGTGMQNKLLESMALGTPCVTTSLANNAIKAENGTEIIVGDSKEELIDACNLLLNNESKRKEIASAAKLFIEENYNWSQSTQSLIDLIRNHLVSR